LALSVSCCFVQRTARRSTDSETRFRPSQVMRSTAGPQCRRRTLACRVASWAQPCIVARGILHLAHCVLICARLGLASLVFMLSRAACCLPRCCVSSRSLPAVNRVSHASCCVAHRALHPFVRRSEALVSRLARGACCCLLQCLVSRTTMNATCPYRVAAALLVGIGEARNAFMRAAFPRCIRRFCMLHFACCRFPCHMLRTASCTRVRRVASHCTAVLAGLGEAAHVVRCMLCFCRCMLPVACCMLHVACCSGSRGRWRGMEGLLRPHVLVVGRLAGYQVGPALRTKPHAISPSPQQVRHRHLCSARYAFGIGLRAKSSGLRAKGSGLRG
jgi:hypothetical protein